MRQFGIYTPAAAITAVLAGSLYFTSTTTAISTCAPHTIVSIYDGDTVTVCNSVGQKEKVRIIGIDAPEMQRGKKPSCLGVEARNRTRALLQDVTFHLERDSKTKNRDYFKRLLRYVEIEERKTDIGAVLLREGLARVYTKEAFSRKEDYKALEVAAKASNLGVWGSTCTNDKK